MDRANNLGFLIACVYLLYHLPTSEASCRERPMCNETVKCDKGWICLESRCHKYFYLISNSDVGCGCPDSDGDHCECPTPTPTPAPTSAPAPECEAGWYTFERSCYLFTTSFSTWPDAKKFCEGKNATLATIESKSEHDMIVGQTPETRHVLYWIGGKYDYTSSKFKWLNGESIDLDYWSPDTPENATGCMAYLKGKWVAKTCNFGFFRLCEKQAG